MKIASLLVALTMALTVQAQVEKVSLQASGLTCSMCSNAIFKALKSLDFVDKVDVDLKTYTFEITFNNQSAVDFDKIKGKVEAAGFSIISFIASVDFKNAHAHSTDPLIVANNRIVLVNGKQQELQGIKQIRILNKGFVSAKEYKKSGLPLADPGTYHAAI